MKIAIIKAVSLLAIGVIVGAGASALYYRQLLVTTMSESILDSCRNDIVESANTLVMLRNEEYSKLIESKEESLSSQIYALSFVPISSDEKRLKAYRMAARYRQKFPFETGDSNVDQSVKEFLAKVPMTK